MPQVRTHAFQWDIQREGYGVFGPGAATAYVHVAAPVNNAEVGGMSVPARMQTKLNDNVAVTMRNTGTTTWTPGALYRLSSLNPHNNQMWGPSRIELASAVAPGQQYTFNFQVKAPAAGDYQMQWGMVQDGVQWFGAAAGSPVVVTEDLSRVTFIHTDGLGSPVARTDGNGNLVNRTRYEPYGYVASGATPTIGFTGHVNDADTGLTYMQQRYYDPVAGRFLSIDPVVTDANTGGSFNRYVYANNSPYKYIDPDGRSPDNAADRFVVDVLQWFGDRPNLVRGLEAAAVAANLGAPGAAGASAEAGIAGGVGAKAAAQVAKVAAPTEARAKNIQRFTSKLPANAKDSVTVKPLPNGGVAAQGVSPGKVPGSSALYESRLIQQEKPFIHEDNHCSGRRNCSREGQNYR